MILYPWYPFPYDSDKSSDEMNMVCVMLANITIVIVFLLLYVNGISFKNKMFDPTYLAEPNQYRRKELVESCNMISGSVDDIEYIGNGVYYVTVLNPDSGLDSIRAYLTEKNIDRIKVSDTITVKGVFTYVESLNRKDLVVGTSVNSQLSSKAYVTDIAHSDS